MKTNFAYATAIQERIPVFDKLYATEEMEDNLTKWLARKSLCTEEFFNFSLEEKGINRETFNLGIKSLTEKDVEHLEREVKEYTWYQKGQEILQEKEIATQHENIDFSYAIRPFLYYFKREIEKIEPQQFTISTIEPFLLHLGEELVQISAKTLVFDLHEQKRVSSFEGETPSERFVYYMKQRFEKQTSIVKFYEEYPVLFRLLTERVLFHIENYCLFVQGIEEVLPEFAYKFDCTPPYQLHELSLGAGDSHGKGKTVILFQLNDKKFVFKYKNLEIGERFNQFLSYLENQTGKQYYQIQRIYKKNFCIEEFVEKKECHNEEEVKNFYHRFGEYVALAYLLCGNDFHYENLVAHGEFPVLIDIETFIQNDTPLAQQNNPFAELSIRKYTSVLASGLLPMKFQENRIEPLVEGENKGLRLSAFDGKKQKLPYKALSLVEVNTDEVRFDYIEHEMEGANNIPVLNGEEVEAKEYNSEVIAGFSEICTYFLTHTLEVTVAMEKIFENVMVRNVIKTTQKYADMLGYGYHPQCMKNYIEREKLFENLWAFNYKNKTSILPEIKDLLVNDIPIFYNNTSSRDLITSDGEVLKNYYERTAIERVREVILNFDEQEYEYQKLRLELSLGIFELKEETIALGKNTEEVLHKVAETLLLRAKYDEKKELVTFEDFFYEPDETLDYTALNAEFYDGLSGIYLFTLYYVKYYPNEKMEELKNALEKTLFQLPKKTKKTQQLSVYHGKYSILYPLLQKYKLENKTEDLNFTEKLLENLEEEIGEKQEEDWLTGVSGFIQVLLDFYHLTKKELFLLKAEKLAEQLNRGKISLCGFSHGYAGVIYASYSLYLATGKAEYLSRVKNYLAKENQHFNGENWEDLRPEKNVRSQWCHGTNGIGLSRLWLLQNGFADNQVKEDFLHCLKDVLSFSRKDSGICHGNIGNYLFLKEVSESDFLPDELSEKVNEKMYSLLEEMFQKGVNIPSHNSQPMLGLMTGITGIGMGMLKAENKNIPSILTLA
ncbi:type 2 lantibiotic biosynthesis protein LanM [Pilibacter termitis]|uniref:Type 2 lantibiotic biosynthesis protein LanM n=1 Tax=Pilibacter termitis TaxID=263852 RepID=A0A1T4KFN8_9ENTE|nr:type 2 lanthipeptide synthetase LanM [Pilibacter termitis]SJZ41221.1 type 2 lantibiotic biosynthesis protein LanM [Pilibacter termitis]